MNNEPVEERQKAGVLDDLEKPLTFAFRFCISKAWKINSQNFSGKETEK